MEEHISGEKVGRTMKNNSRTDERMDVLSYVRSDLILFVRPGKDKLYCPFRPSYRRTSDGQ